MSVCRRGQGQISTINHGVLKSVPHLKRHQLKIVNVQRVKRSNYKQLTFKIRIKLVPDFKDNRSAVLT